MLTKKTIIILIIISVSIAVGFVDMNSKSPSKAETDAEIIRQATDPSNIDLESGRGYRFEP